MFAAAQKNLIELSGMKNALAVLARQAWPILVSALAAAGLAFAQSVAAHAGLCPAPAASPDTVAVLGGSFKAAHQAIVYLVGGTT